MVYEKIPFDTVRQIVLNIFNSSDKNQDFSLSPDAIHTLAESSGIQLEWLPIVNWTECFDLDTYEYSSKDFLEIAFAKAQPSAG